MCTPEALTRWYYYPPPYYDTITHIWRYRHPWLWYDGNKRGGRDYVNWRGRITSAMNVPASVNMTIYGSYDPVMRNGTVRIVYRNDSTGAIRQARAITLITEDSIRWRAPSGDSIHNNVARDYLPDPGGQIISIPAGDSVIIAQGFTLHASWNDTRCMINAWLQNDSLTADSVKRIYQGGKKLVRALVSVEEETAEKTKPRFWAAPNPCRNSTNLVFACGDGRSYRIGVFDALGRKVREMVGIARGTETTVRWDCRDDRSKTVAPGVYFFRINTDLGSPAFSGKVIVR